jgi:hypothetical protein
LKCNLIISLDSYRPDPSLQGIVNLLNEQEAKKYNDLELSMQNTEENEDDELECLIAMKHFHLYNSSSKTQFPSLPKCQSVCLKEMELHQMKR